MIITFCYASRAVDVAKDVGPEEAVANPAVRSIFIVGC